VPEDKKSDEPQDERVEDVKQIFQLYLAQYERGICPYCRESLKENETQVGRSVYCKACNNRLFQGIARYNND
jgi:hypothetical protein